MPPCDSFIGKARTSLPSEALTAFSCFLRSLRVLGSKLNALGFFLLENIVSTETSVGVTRCIAVFILGLGVEAAPGKKLLGFTVLGLVEFKAFLNKAAPGFNRKLRRVLGLFGNILLFDHIKIEQGI